ncbi:MAG: TRAP transporter substrate-binding protein [Granulosicoccus sp.]|nr:TRAP transporter substrate-binding protein [Granulosicoccus sp.]
MIHTTNFTRRVALTTAAIAIGVGLQATTALAADDVHTLRIQTHFGPETVSGKLAAQFVDDIQVMSNGQLEIEMFYSSAVVKSVETFDAAATGILDGDMTGGSYQVGKDPAFQFAGDIMGAYDTPYQQHAWFFNGGEEVANKLYNKFGMELIGWWIPGQESLSSSKPLAGPSDLKNWKFRSPPGLETKIFQGMGASPIVMDFTEIFTALETKIIDGADASGLANNVGLGLYDLVKHATYPGFHSMPSDHLAINKTKWDALPEHLQRIMKVAMQKLAFQTALTFEIKNQEAAAELAAAGVTLHSWSQEDRNAFRAASQAAWDDFAGDSETAKLLIQSHKDFIQKLGL